jgi:hypothetical protein
MCDVWKALMYRVSGRSVLPLAVPTTCQLARWLRAFFK